MQQCFFVTVLSSCNHVPTGTEEEPTRMAQCTHSNDANAIICLLFWCVLLVSHAIIIHSGLCHACGIVLTVPNEDWIRSSTTTRSTSKPCVCLNHLLWWYQITQYRSKARPQQTPKGMVHPPRIQFGKNATSHLGIEGGFLRMKDTRGKPYAIWFRLHTVLILHVSSEHVGLPVQYAVEQ